MRIDREGFLLAVAALTGCERADAPAAAPAVATVRHEVQRPAVAMVPRTAAPETPPAPVITVRPSEPTAEVTPAPAPVPKPSAPRRRPVSAAKRWFLGLSVEQRGHVTSLCEQSVSRQCPRELSRAPIVGTEEETEVASGDGVELPTPQPPEDPEQQFLAGMSSQQRAQATAYCSEVTPFPAPHCETPLVVAFDNQPVEFAPAGPERFAFVPGVSMATDWPTAVTPWIALDLDGDGAITSGAELFGSSTVLASGTARNGFEALGALDTNGDGTIDAGDPMFARLMLWSDLNHDRRSSPDELRPLAQVVSAIPLAHTIDARCNTRGDCEGERGTLRWRDVTGAEHVGAVVDVYVPRR